ncbi:hypothetical protein BC939DRAFT_311257 [Gamsiella multidivaricata]|uniref:uncharacterized protein n=1 Tax=Gamsiella multidivaricata TaxID=101098 RepID=UPI00221E9974|nr:uncharacterized protein BC939DRAFT_311257 [Gamsiella multidivaricata]KAI7817894.1 hypothetical protein BC939DRAFT_311257 [Gamsiella multidivaricata]
MVIHMTRFGPVPVHSTTNFSSRTLVRQPMLSGQAYARLTWGSQVPAFRQQEKRHQNLIPGKRQRSRTTEGFVQHLSQKVQRDTIRSSANLLLAGNAMMTKVSLEGLDALSPSTLLRTPTWNSDSDEKPVSPVPFPTLAHEPLTSTGNQTIVGDGPFTNHHTSISTDDIEEPTEGENDDAEFPDPTRNLTHFETLIQATSWS